MSIRFADELELGFGWIEKERLERASHALAGLGVEKLLVGHGEGLHGQGTAVAIDDAVNRARRRIPRWLAGLPRALR